MKKAITIGITTAVFLLCMTESSQAIMIGFQPSSQTVPIGSSSDVDVVISDLGGEIVSAFDLDVSYDSTVVTATGVNFGTFLGDPDPLAFETLTSIVLSPGLVDFAELSFLSDSDLDLLQPDTFVLATLSFNTLSEGISPLNFVFDAFIDVKGRNAQVLQLDAVSGSVDVVSAVPEPNTLLLLGTGLVVFWAMKWRAFRKGLKNSF